MRVRGGGRGSRAAAAAEKRGVRASQLVPVLFRGRYPCGALRDERQGREVRGRAAPDRKNARSRIVDDVLPRLGRKLAGTDERSEISESHPARGAADACVRLGIRRLI